MTIKVISCRTCKHNRPRTLKVKTCKAGLRAVFGYGCKKWKSGSFQNGNDQEEVTISA